MSVNLLLYHKLWHNARLLALINTTDHSSTNKSIEMVVMVVTLSCRSCKVYERPHYMAVVHAASQLLEVFESRKRKGEALKCKTD